MFAGKNILILAPHIDDGEFGCGGTISRLVEEGCTVKYVAFADCKESLPAGLSADTLRRELSEAAALLGIDSSLVEVLDFNVRHFPRDRQQVLQQLIDIKKKYQPDIIFTPCTADVHQDHQVVTAEAIRAYKDKTILGYELPWNCLELPSQMIVEVTEQQLLAKVRAIECYQSQAHRPYHNERYIKAMATTRGLRVNKEYAEAFEPIRIVL